MAKLLSARDRARAWFVIDELFGGDDSDEDRSIDFTSPSFLAYLQSSKALSDLANTRYLRDRIIRKPSTNVFEEDLRVEEDGTHWMNDNEFLNKYRMDRETLDAVTEMIEDHPVFKRGRRGRRQRPVKHQLMTLLHFLGKEGETNLSQRNTLKIGAGSAEKYRERVVKALCHC